MVSNNVLADTELPRCGAVTADLKLGRACIRRPNDRQRQRHAAPVTGASNNLLNLLCGLCESATEFAPRSVASLRRDPATVFSVAGRNVCSLSTIPSMLRLAHCPDGSLSLV